MKKRRVFVELDGLRGVAALAVLTRHAPDGLFRDWLPGSYLAVDLFFALSGFVIAHAYADSLTVGMSTARFALLRVIRLYPLYLLGTALGLIVLLPKLAAEGGIQAGPLLAAFGLNALFVPVPPELAIGRGETFPFNFPSWSLTFELIVNIVYAALILWLTGWRLGLLLAASFAGLIWATADHGSLDMGWTFATLPGGFARTIFSFYVGTVIYVAKDRLPWLRAPFWVLAPLLLLSFMIDPGPGARAVTDLLLITTLYPLMIIAAANVRENAGGGAVMRELGVASYAIYILHMPIIALVRGIFLKGLNYPYQNLGGWGTIALAGGILLAASIVDRLYDRPVRRFLTRITNARRVTAVQS
ncbi:hypothetical protein COC42_16665 [Sphingomonas spermidinifaciens]|uniref:Acyltransferase 3 domain-containing protein n=1 Tax=Sphingomonas spermidinifaciens TaxID=1141889 RepID=A0A2A4AXS4_9SPHN|nr:acyltransferase [Sphingomonas spermidinifaciens]PCD01743.1 hypothetical protein COC42_16665 [Sphingomonas spermidinifaciens]